MRRILAGLPALLAIILLAAAGFAELVRDWWVGELFAHFRWQFAAMAAFGLLLAVALRCRVGAACLVLAALPHLWALQAYPVAAWVRPDSGGATALRVVSANLLSSNRTPAAALGFVRGSGADIVCLQEVSSGWAPLLERLKSRYPHVVPQRRTGSTVLLSRFPFASAREVAPNGRLPHSVARVETPAGAVDVACVHPPYPMSAALWRFQRAEFRDYAAAAQRHDGPRIVMGDFNSTPYSARFRRLLETGGLAGVELGPWWPRTWPSGERGHWLQRLAPGFPIDHVLVSCHFGVISARRGPPNGSDHFPVIVDLAMPGCDNRPDARSASAGEEGGEPPDGCDCGGKPDADDDDSTPDEPRAMARDQPVGLDPELGH